MGNPYIAPVAIQTGGNVLGALGDALTESDDERWLKFMREWLKRMQSQPGITDQQIQGMIPAVQKGLTPQVNTTAQNVANRVGLDSGAAQGAIAQAQLGPLFQWLARMKEKQAFYNAERPFRMLQVGAGLRG